VRDFFRFCCKVLSDRKMEWVVNGYDPLSIVAYTNFATEPKLPWPRRAVMGKFRHPERDVQCTARSSSPDIS
jgi:hypothetical protein